MTIPNRILKRLNILNYFIEKLRKELKIRGRQSKSAELCAIGDGRQKTSTNFVL